MRNAMNVVRVTAHPPERRRRHQPVQLAMACCCCCCCCCLHTIGGLAGGLSGSLMRVPHVPRPVDPSFPFPFRRDDIELHGPTFPVAGLYWLVVGFLVAVVSVWVFVQGSWPSLRPEMLLAGLMVALFFLPVIQLVAVLPTLIGIVAFYEDRRHALRRLGKITLWGFVGTLAGTLIMVGTCGAIYVAAQVAR